jgi:hypothetical protein
MPRPVRLLLLLGLAGLTGCASAPDGAASAAMAEQLLREVCLPFVADGVDAQSAGRNLDGRWRREPPDPFTPRPGPGYRSSGARLELDVARQFPRPDGSLTPERERACNVWLDSPNEAPLIAAGRAAATGRPGVVILPDHTPADPALRPVACLPVDGGWAVIRTSSYAGGQTGFGVYRLSSGRRASVCPGPGQGAAGVAIAFQPA